MKKKLSLDTQGRRGAVLVLCAFVIVALLTVIAVSLNLSWIQFKRLQAQSAADLGSISAVSHFAIEREEMLDPAPSQALAARVVALNEGRPLVEPSRIRFGFVADQNVHNPVFVEDTTGINAASVDRSQSATQVPLFMGSLLGRSNHFVSAKAVSTYPPLNIVLCLDASRSMIRRPDETLPPGSEDIHGPPQPGSRWNDLTSTVDRFLTQVAQSNPYVRVGLVTFGGGFPSIPSLGLSPLDEDAARTEQTFRPPHRSSIRQIMDSYAAMPRLGLGTYIFDAIKHSEALMQNHGNRKAVRMIILLSDGRQVTHVDGAGTRPEPYLAVDWTKANGVPIHTINFQTGPNPTLSRVADETGGLALDASDAAALDAAFEHLAQIAATRLAR